MYHSFKLSQIIGVFLLIMTVTIQGHAQDYDRHTKLAIYPESYAVQAGQDLDVVVEQRIAPHWHTYWKNPGDSGAAPVFTWHLPHGWSVSDIQYPAPDKIEYGPLLNYGYSDRALLMQTLNAPEDYDGSPVEVTADLEVLVCKDICVPEYDSFTFTLNDGNAQTYTDLVAEAKTHMPQLSDLAASYYEHEHNLHVKAILPQDIAQQNITKAYIIPKEWGAVTNAAPVTFMQNGDELTITQPRGEQGLDEFTQLETLLYVETDDHKHVFGLLASPHDTLTVDHNALGLI